MRPFFILVFLAVIALPKRAEATLQICRRAVAIHAHGNPLRIPGGFGFNDPVPGIPFIGRLSWSVPQAEARQAVHQLVEASLLSGPNPYHHLIAVELSTEIDGPLNRWLTLSSPETLRLRTDSLPGARLPLTIEVERFPDGVVVVSAVLPQGKVFADADAGAIARRMGALYHALPRELSVPLASARNRDHLRASELPLTPPGMAGFLLEDLVRAIALSHVEANSPRRNEIAQEVKNAVRLAIQDEVILSALRQIFGDDRKLSRLANRFDGVLRPVKWRWTDVRTWPKALWTAFYPESRITSVEDFRRWVNRYGDPEERSLLEPRIAEFESADQSLKKGVIALRLDVHPVENLGVTLDVVLSYEARLEDGKWAFSALDFDSLHSVDRGVSIWLADATARIATPRAREAEPASDALIVAHSRALMRAIQDLQRQYRNRNLGILDEATALEPDPMMVVTETVTVVIEETIIAYASEPDAFPDDEPAEPDWSPAPPPDSSARLILDNLVPGPRRPSSRFIRGTQEAEIAARKAELIALAQSVAEFGALKVSFIAELDSQLAVLAPSDRLARLDRAITEMEGLSRFSADERAMLSLNRTLIAQLGTVIKNSGVGNLLQNYVRQIHAALMDVARGLSRSTSEVRVRVYPTHLIQILSPGGKVRPLVRKTSSSALPASTSATRARVRALRVR